MNNTMVFNGKMFWWLMKKNKFLTVSWLSGLLSAEIFISTGEGPEANTDWLKQLISAVRASGGFPRNVLVQGAPGDTMSCDETHTWSWFEDCSCQVSKWFEHYFMSYKLSDYSLFWFCLCMICTLRLLLFDFVFAWTLGQ